MFDNVDYDKVGLKYLFALQRTQVQVSPKHASKNKVEEAKFGTAPPVRITVAFSAFTLSAARPLHCSMSTNVYIPQNGK